MKKFDWSHFYGLDDDNEIEKNAQSILNSMNLEQKANQLAGDENFILGLIKMGKKYNSYPLPAGVDDDLGIPGILFSDGPRGCVMGKATCFPVSMARGASFDRDLEERIGDVIGTEIRSLGANFFGGVCINLLRHPAWGRAQETYGEDPYHLGEFGVALTHGIQKHTMACVKHYACNSMENMRFKVDVMAKDRPLREIYLRHFKKCVDSGIASIMSAYNKVNGHYCGHNKQILTDILKNEWGFKGFVISDFTLGIRNGKKALEGGLDIEMPQKWRMKPNRIVKQVNEGRIDIKYIDESVKRILYQKIRFASPEQNKKYNKKRVACKEHQDIALEAARKSMVLLKNQDNFLPLQINNTNKSKENLIKSIAIIGELANTVNVGDRGSSRVYPPFVITPLKGIEDFVNQTNSKTIITYDSNKKLDNAIEIANNSDVVILVVGYTHIHEGEYVFYKGGDRKSLSLLQKDIKLIQKISEVNSNCIVVMEGGSAIITEEWKNDVKSIIMAWYPGMMGGQALAEIIFGKISPSGKIPCIFPKSAVELPYFDIKAKKIEYDLYHGYRYQDKHDLEPAFAFGFGLSYTSFSYSNLKLKKEKYSISDDIEFSVDLENTGYYNGDEIIQVYLEYALNSRVERPKKELKAFSRVSLVSGERKTVQLQIKNEDLAYYDEEMKKWNVEPLNYTIYVGGCSEDPSLLETSFKIE